MPIPVVTRFAPSPTGQLHLGNARTALFSWAFARRHGGRFLLRIEDTDRARSAEALVQEVLDDLHWLGLDWDAGPDRDDAAGPYRQSERGAHYATACAALEAAGRAYPCFCTELELELGRKAALAAGRPPRYAGTCAALDAGGRARCAAQGRAATLRFRVTPGRSVAYHDLVRGEQCFATDDLGDFVIRRADGSPAFLFCNALDDAAMGVTDVLRGEDHVANTPRQLLVLAALGAAAPRYGHLPLLVGADGTPLSKRHGAASLSALRSEGFLPAALLNLLARLGHHYTHDGWLETRALVEGFDLGALGRAPARFDAAQLRHWQREAVQRAPASVLEAWVGADVPPGSATAFVGAVRDNLLLPADAAEWAQLVYGELPDPGDEARATLVAAGPGYFDAALAALGDGTDATALLAALQAATGRKGRALYGPLRGALTQRHDGPELVRLLAVMPAETLRARLAAARAIAAA